MSWLDYALVHRWELLFYAQMFALSTMIVVVATVIDRMEKAKKKTIKVQTK